MVEMLLLCLYTGNLCGGVSFNQVLMPKLIATNVNWLKHDTEKYFIKNLKAHRQISKNSISKRIVHVIKHVNFQLYRLHPDGVI